MSSVRTVAIPGTDSPEMVSHREDLSDSERHYTDVILVAELAGHANLETIRRYSLPNANDRQEAINATTIGY